MKIIIALYDDKQEMERYDNLNCSIMELAVNNKFTAFNNSICGISSEIYVARHKVENDGNAVIINSLSTLR